MFERIKILCDKTGTNITSLCKEITGSSGNIPTWKKGNIRSDYLLKVAQYFNVSPNYLLTGAEYGLEKDETELLSDYRLLTAQGKEYIRQTMVMAKTTYKKDGSVSDMEVATEIG